jgi:uncharacterized protein YrzB (UPF0473 family)
LIIGTNEEGNEVLYRKVLEFYHPEFKKEYVILAEEGAQSSSLLISSCES